MSLNTRTYNSIKLLAEAKNGHNYSDDELLRFNALINAAAQNAYESHNFWERFIVFAEPRTISRCTIDFTEDSFNVYGAGTDTANGLYVRSGDANGKPSYTMTLAGDSNDYFLYWDTITDVLDHRWVIEQWDTDNQRYESSEDVATPDLVTAWTSTSEGEDPSPLLVDVAEIETPLDIHLQGPPHGTMTSIRKKYLVTDRGIQLLSNGTGATLAYVTYKKRLTDVYGDGESGTVSDIPAEWAEYMARYAARDYQISQRQSNASPFAIIGSTEVERALEDQLWRLESQNIEETIGRRILTQLATTNTLY